MEQKTKQKLKLVEVESFVDHRASRYFDIYPDLAGQVTVSIVKPDQFSGWHRHKLQYDQFFVAKGRLKISVISPDGDVKDEILDAGSPKMINIPQEYWHCYRSFEEEAVLVYWLSRKHDESDEYRATEEEIERWYGHRA